VRVWALRVVWLTLPLSAGGAAADAIDGFADAPRVVAAVLLWLLWALGVLALLAPRPESLTALRVVAPTAAVLAVVALVTGRTDGLSGWGSLAATMAAAALTSDTEVAILAVNSGAYGDERRFPLRVPPGLFLGPLPVVRALVVASAGAGPLLLADGRVALGVVAVVVGVPVVVLGARALHGLSRRWFVLVPAGAVVVDPLTLADPVLFVRQHVRVLRAARGDAPVPEGDLDLRLGATLGTIELRFDEPADLVRVSRARRGGATVSAEGLLVATVRRRELLAAASQRRVRVEVAEPPTRRG